MEGRRGGGGRGVEVEGWRAGVELGGVDGWRGISIGLGGPGPKPAEVV